MANNIKPIGKLPNRPSSPRRRGGTSTRAERATASTGGRAVAATDHAPVIVGRGPIPTATGIAQRLGWLEREAALDGTPLVVAGDTSEAPPRTTLLRAAAPTGALREGESVRALWERSEGRATRLIGLTWVETYQAVVALPDASISSPAQLGGHRLGLPRDDAAAVDARRAAARRGIHAALGLGGLFPDEVVHVDLDAPAGLGETYAPELAALACGEVDAVFLAGAAGAAAAARIGAVEVARVGEHLDPRVRAGATTPAALTVDAELLERRPNLVVRLLAVLLRTAAWAQLNREDATRLLAAETRTTPHDVTVAHGLGWHEQLHLDLSHRKLDALRAQHDFLLTHGFLARAIDFGAWIDPRPLGVARELLAAERTAWV
jgi:ABC-type nitrate/sulfonate/bicarbonate transport system substrate-binding protein